MVISASSNKKRKSISHIARTKQGSHPVVIGLDAAKATSIITKVKSMEVDGFNNVSSKKSARLARLPLTNPILF